MAEFRKDAPVRRTDLPQYATYGRYKSDLRLDFRSRCGYTDCSDFWFGGSRTFHIDHFRPKSVHPNLETDYQNLVYCCSYVNIQKSDDDSDYLDPCNDDYNEHFERDAVGNIIPKQDSEIANYMYDKLKLYLRRYQIIWMLDKIRENKNKLNDLLGDARGDEDLEREIKDTYFDLDREFEKYLDYLKSEQ